MAYSFEEQKGFISEWELDYDLKEHIFSKYDSIEKLKKLATSGQDSQAKADMSRVYQFGIPELNIKPDLDSAIGWMEASIDCGNKDPNNIYNLGVLHDCKKTIPHERKAYELYLQAAKSGVVVRAEIKLGEMYRCGVEGVGNEDINEAFKWIKRAAGEETSDGYDPATYAIRGNLRKSDIKFQLGALKLLHKNYLDGDCPERKPQPIKALLYLKKAAELGDSVAQKDLGLSYLAGESGQPKDLDKAKRWLGKAANNGDQEAKEVLEKLNDQSQLPVAAIQPEMDQHIIEGNFKQFLDILTLNCQQNQHPYLIKNPMLFQESTFTQYPNSPTAQHYLKAFKLVKESLKQLQSSHFKDPKGITLLAHGYLYENSIRQSFPQLNDLNFLESVFTLVEETIKVNPNFLEGLLTMHALQKTGKHIDLKSFKIDLRKTMVLNNLIHLIKKAEPNMQPTEDPYNFEQNYSSWLHVLYYYLGSQYTIAESYEKGAEAFQESLNCCPNYFEAKMALAYCLMSISLRNSVLEQQKIDASNADKELDILQLKTLSSSHRIAKGDYLSWTQEELRQKAKQLFMEYIQEAPECDKKYQDGHYHMAALYILERDMQEAVKWKERGEDSEEKRLPFMEPVLANSKKMLAFLDMLPPTPKKEKSCSNRKCPKKRRYKVTLKPCPCHEVSYCGSECQAEDWKEHKKICSYKRKTS